MFVDRYNETDVREEFIAPWLKRLGYSSGAGGSGDIRREVELRYPQDQLGRKKPKTDPKLRGKVDYVMAVQTPTGSISWILEAKAPNQPIDAESRAQAYTYARHPEIGARLYAICNGREMVVLNATVDSVSAVPIVQEQYPCWTTSQALDDLLGAEAFKQRYSDCINLDGQPLGAGLGPSMRIASGKISYRKVPDNFAALSNILISVVGGTVERSGNGGIRFSIEIQHFDTRMDDMFRRLGLIPFVAVSRETRLSSTPDLPTICESRVPKRVLFPAGEKLVNQFGSEVNLERDVSGDIHWRWFGVLTGAIFGGRVELLFSLDLPGCKNLCLEGHAEVRLCA